MSKARDLADFISTGSILSDGTIESTEISGVTATANELNVLDGITVTTEELNNVAGVNSDVQTQLDGKQDVVSGVSDTEIGYLDGVTSNLQTQLDNITVTAGTLTKSFTSGETASIALSAALSPAPVVSVTKEVPQTGQSSKGAWDVATDGVNYDRHNTAYDTTLTPTTPYDYSSGSDETQADIDADVGTPISVAFSDDGLKYFVLDTSSTVYEYSLSTAYDVDTQTLTTSFDASTQVTTGFVLRFKPDGTKMYVGNSTTTIYQYSLSTAWDVSTATYDSKSYDATTQITATRGLAFNPDGSDMYIGNVSGTTTKVFQYSLSTPWDISTASYASKTITLSTSWIIGGLDISPLGTTLLLGRETYDDIVTFDIATAWDISTLNTSGTVITSTSLSNTNGVGLSVDGAKLAFTGGASGNAARVGAITFTESTPYLALGSGSFASTDVGKTIEGNGGEVILTATDGSYSVVTAFNDSSTIAAGNWDMYALTFDATNGVELSGLNNIYDIASASYDSISFDVTSQEGSPEDFAFNSDGTKMYVIGNDAGSLFQYSLSTAFDLSTASYDSVSFIYTNEVNQPEGLAFSSTGARMYILDRNSGSPLIFEYNLSTAFDISSAVYSYTNFSVTSQDNDAKGFSFNNDGTKMYVTGGSGSVFQYSLSDAFEVASASYDSVSLNVSSQQNVPEDLTFNSDGTKMYIVGASSDAVYQYTLSTAFDLSTASYDSVSFDVSSQDTTPLGVNFSADGTKMYTIGTGSDAVYQYSTEQVTQPTAQYSPAITNASGQIDTAFWTDINSMTADQTANDGEVYYAVSTDDRTTWSVIKDSDGVRPIVRDNAGTWEYNSNTTYGSTTWTAATSNTEMDALQEALGATSVNRMNKTQLDAVTDPNHYTLGDSLDLMIALYMGSNGTSPTSDGVSINYDAEALNQGAVLGTDYDYDFPDSTTVRITSNAAQNLKVRVV